MLFSIGFECSLHTLHTSPLSDICKANYHLFTESACFCIQTVIHRAKVVSFFFILPFVISFPPRTTYSLPPFFSWASCVQINQSVIKLTWPFNYILKTGKPISFVKVSSTESFSWQQMALCFLMPLSLNSVSIDCFTLSVYPPAGKQRVLVQGGYLCE